MSKTLKKTLSIILAILMIATTMPFLLRAVITIMKIQSCWISQVKQNTTIVS